MRIGEEKRTSVLSGTREESEIPAGVEYLIALNTMNSAFDNFLRDYNTLKEDRN